MSALCRKKIISLPLSTYLPTYLPTYLHTYLSTYLPIYIPTYLHTYLPTYLPIYIPTTKRPTLLLSQNYKYVLSSDWLSCAHSNGKISIRALECVPIKWSLQHCEVFRVVNNSKIWTIRTNFVSLYRDTLHLNLILSCLSWIIDRHNRKLQHYSP